MEIKTNLKKAQNLNNDDNPAAAIKILKPLYKSHPDNLEIILEVVTAFESLEQWENARGMLVKAIRINPQVNDYWIRLSYLYQYEEDLGTALKAINKGLTYITNDISLLVQKAYLLASTGKVTEMHALINKTIKLYPEEKNDLLVERASIYESQAYQPQADEEQIKDVLGVNYSVSALKQAVRDLTDALDPTRNNLQIKIKRARLHKLLQDFDSAISDYDDALTSLDEEEEFHKEFIREEREKCINGGMKEREQLANTLRQGLINIDDKDELSQDDLIANSLLDAMAGELAKGGDMISLIDEIEDPDQLIALNIAQDILKNAQEPDADFTATNKNDYEKSAQKFCDKVEKELKRIGYTTFGDYEPRGLSQQIGKRILLRLFASENQRICAAAYQIKPAKPSFLLWLLLIIQGKWKKNRIVELESETVDGKFIITNNTGDINPFGAGNSIDMQNLPVKATVSEVITAHIVRLQNYNEDELTLISDTDALFSMQERLRLIKNSYRESIGYITDNELRKLLGKQHDKYAADIRKYIKKLSTDLPVELLKTGT